MVMDGCGQLLDGYWWLLIVMGGYRWLWMVIDSYGWLFMVLGGLMVMKGLGILGRVICKLWHKSKCTPELIVNT